MGEAEKLQYELVDPAHNVYQCPACGHLEQFEADGPQENGWVLCPHCGGTLG